MGLRAEAMNLAMKQAAVVVYTDRITKERYRGKIDRIWMDKDGKIGADIVIREGIPSVMRCLAEDLEKGT